MTKNRARSVDAVAAESLKPVYQALDAYSEVIQRGIGSGDISPEAAKELIASLRPLLNTFTDSYQKISRDKDLAVEIDTLTNTILHNRLIAGLDSRQN